MLTALRLGMFFNMGPRLWLNPPSAYDIRVAERELRAKSLAANRRVSAGRGVMTRVALAAVAVQLDLRSAAG